MQGNTKTKRLFRHAPDLMTSDSVCGQACGVALRKACTGGHLHVAQWLGRTFSLASVKEHISSALQMILRRACGRGKMTLVQWLRMAFCIDSHYALAVWSRARHCGWYWLPHVVVMSTCLSHDTLVDVLRQLDHVPRF
jgi:ATP:corrinoid adenosyltransferase